MREPTCHYPSSNCVLVLVLVSDMLTASLAVSRLLKALIPYFVEGTV